MYLQVHDMVAYLRKFTWLWLRCSFRRLCHHQTPFTFEGVAPSGPPLWSFSLALGSRAPACVGLQAAVPLHGVPFWRHWCRSPACVGLQVAASP